MPACAHCLPLLPAAQVEVLSAALRASCLDAHEEASSVEKRSDLQDEPGINELPNCKLTQDDSVPLICDAVEVTNHEVLTAQSGLPQRPWWGWLWLVTSS